MANKIWRTKSTRPCPRCGEEESLLATYHFGATFEVECKGCGLGRAHGDSEEIALARQNNKYYEYEAAQIIKG